MEKRIGNIQSITLGVNMDGSLQAKDAGIVSINVKPYRDGNIVDKLLGKTGEDSYTCLTSLFSIIKTLDKHDQLAFQSTIDHCLNQIFRKNIRNFEPLINKYFAGSTDFLVAVIFIGENCCYQAYICGIIKMYIYEILKLLEGCEFFMIKLFADTASNLPVALNKKYNVNIIPLSYTRDGIEIPYDLEHDFEEYEDDNQYGRFSDT